MIGSLKLRGRDSGGNATDYAKVKGKILDPTNGSEDGTAIISALVAGVETDVVTVGPGVQIGAPTGGDKGAGTLNAAAAIYQNGVNVGAFSTQLLHIRDERSSGTDGGTSVATTWTKRTLADIKTNEIGGASAAASVITLPAGTYWLQGWAITYRDNGAQLRWRNTSDGTTTLNSISGWSNSASSLGHQIIPIDGRFTIAATKNFELQYWVNTTMATTGLGNAVATGEVEVYADLKIWKL